MDLVYNDIKTEKEEGDSMTSSHVITDLVVDDDNDEELFKLKKRRDTAEGIDSIDSSKFFNREDGRADVDWNDEEVRYHYRSL